ncbi:putative reverse transcriptase domain-containing protein [Tanacetum coccineum]
MAAAVVASPARVALCSSSSSSLAFTPPTPCQTVPALTDLPHRSAILVLPGQDIPFGRPYHTHPNGAHMLLNTRKRVHPFPAPIPANRRRFHSSSSSSPRKRRRVSPYPSSSTTHSSSPMSARPSHKRCRSPTANSPLIRVDLLPPRKRLRDPSSAYYHEVSVEVSIEMDIKDSIETRAEGDIERDVEDSYDADIESNIDSNILENIEADIAAKAVAAIKADTTADVVAAVEADVEPVEVWSKRVDAEIDAEPSAGDTIEISVVVVDEPVVPDDLPMVTVGERLNEIEEVVQGMYEHLLDIPIERLDDIEEEIRVLEGSKIGLRDALGVERDMTASVERRLGYMSEDLRRIRLAYQYDRADFRRLETYMIMHHGYLTSSHSTSHHVVYFMTRTMTITRSEMTPKAIKELINQCVAEALAAQEANCNVGPIVGSENQYGEKEETAFQLLKQKLCNAPILALPEGSENFMVYCDASHKGLGMVLM